MKGTAKIKFLSDIIIKYVVKRGDIGILMPHSSDKIARGGDKQTYTQRDIADNRLNRSRGGFSENVPVKCVAELFPHDCVKMSQFSPE